MAANSRGLSLVELMVAMAISLILLLGVIQIYVSSTATSRAQEGLSRVQENARFALDAMQRDLRMAGHSGCPRTEPPEMTIMANHADSDYLLSGRYVEGVDDATDTDPDFWLNGEPDDLVEGQPAIRVTFTSGTEVGAEPGSFGNSAEFDLDSNTIGLRQNDFVVVTNCRTAHVAEITNDINEGTGTVNLAHGAGGGQSGGGNSPHQWDGTEQDYDDGAQVMRQHSYTYYIAQNGRDIPALYRRDDMRSDDQAEILELVENVEAMRIAYGEDTDGDLQVDQYRPASALSDNDWDSVISVRVALLLRSDEVLSETFDTSYDLLGQDVLNFNDSRRIRQMATATVSLRNRLQ